MSPPLRFVLATFAAIATAVLTARLGFWQLERAAQKMALQAALDERGRLPPLDAAALATSPEAAVQQHQRRVQLSGRWSRHTVFLDNRQLAGPQPGFFVLTPLQLADGRAVLVQRGWAPRDAADRTRLPTFVTPDGEVRFEGRIAPAPARTFAFAGEDRGRIRQNLDLGDFARETGLPLAPLTVLQLDNPGAPADGLQRAWPAPSTGVDRHRGYAFQWFALATLVATLYVWFQFIHPRRRR
jgi:surfeit locus 1 family protein